LFTTVALASINEPSSGAYGAFKNGVVTAYTTKADQSKLFEKTTIQFSSEAKGGKITLNKGDKLQQMDGFGAAISGSTAYNLLKMSQADRTTFLKHTFDPVEGLGYSFIRISIGCSDFSLEDYTYCDTEGLNNFDIHSLDKRDLIPILKEILAINPTLKIIASPWTPPLWMKVSNLIIPTAHKSFISGYLDTKKYEDYANYFVKYIQKMKEYGITIDFVTLQNEPLNKGNSASCYMGYKQQRDFIKVLGPIFRNSGVTTKIILYDHNYNYDNIASQKHYPVLVLDDAEANQYIYGTGFHAYGGDKSEIDYVKEKYPNKEIYFTEISIGEWSYTFDGDLMWNMREVGIGTINKGAKGVVVWNLMLDNEHGPYRPKGCSNCYGAVDIDKSDYKTLNYRSHYYSMGHLARVVKNGAYRIGNNAYAEGNLYYSTFINPDNSYGMVLLNDGNSDKELTVNDGQNQFVVSLPSKSVVSLHW
jgi:glucosylceramidase